MGNKVELDVSTGKVSIVDDPAVQEEPLSKRVARLKNELRATRNARLRETDWTQLPDAPLTEPQKAAWAAYRQALRDLPARVPDTDLLSGKVSWPAPPGDVEP